MVVIAHQLCLRSADHFWRRATRQVFREPATPAPSLIARVLTVFERTLFRRMVANRWFKLYRCVDACHTQSSSTRPLTTMLPTDGTTVVSQADVSSSVLDVLAHHLPHIKPVERDSLKMLLDAAFRKTLTLWKESGTEDVELLVHALPLWSLFAFGYHEKSHFSEYVAVVERLATAEEALGGWELLELVALCTSSAFGAAKDLRRTTKTQQNLALQILIGVFLSLAGQVVEVARSGRSLLTPEMLRAEDRLLDLLSLFTLMARAARGAGVSASAQHPLARLRESDSCITISEVRRCPLMASW